MRTPLALALALALVLGAGCVSPSPPPETRCDPVTTSDCGGFGECGPTAACVKRAAPAANGTVGPPELPVGRAFVYATKRVYDPDAEKTVIVAKRDASGYLFAGAAKDDLVYAVAWGDDLYGERALDGDAAKGWDLLQFPMRDGATWNVTKQLAVVALAANVTTPLGVEPGFVIEGRLGKAMHVRYEYAPSLGAIARYQYDYYNVPMDAYELTRVTTASSYLWVAPVKPLVVGDPAAPGALDVGKADAVVLSAGGAGGGRVTIAMPDGSAWQGAFPETSAPFSGTWTNDILEPKAGKWVVSVQGDPDVPIALPSDAPRPLGWAAASIAPVSWIDGHLV